MKTLIDKRNEYSDRIDDIRNRIDSDVANYKATLEAEVERKLSEKRAQLVTASASDISKLKERIAILDEMLNEDSEATVEVARPEVSTTEAQTVLAAFTHPSSDRPGMVHIDIPERR